MPSGLFSDYSEIKSGVPQGSVLGPLFLIYINDFENIKSNSKFFGDDTMLFFVVKVPVKSPNDLNHDGKWSLILTLVNKQLKAKKVSPNHPQLIFNGIM